LKWKEKEWCNTEKKWMKRFGILSSALLFTRPILLSFFFVFRFISLPQYFSFARFLYSYLYGVAHDYAHRKQIKKKDGTRQLFLRPSHHTERKWRRISPPHAMAITGCK
jgi:hypothetical protein